MSEWISVDERLPERYKTVICMCNRQVEGKGRIPLALSRMEIGFCKVKSGLLHFQRAAGLSPTGCHFRSCKKEAEK